jgi:hypothetical protein
VEKRGWYLFLTLLLLTVAAGAILTAENLPQDRRQAPAEEFQRLVGGLGFGPALDLSDCIFGFDPRLDAACAFERGPIPGGACFCPRHAGSLFCYAELPRETPRLWENIEDALSP